MGICRHWTPRACAGEGRDAITSCQQEDPAVKWRWEARSRPRPAALRCSCCFEGTRSTCRSQRRSAHLERQSECCRPLHAPLVAARFGFATRRTGTERGRQKEDGDQRERNIKALGQIKRSEPGRHLWSHQSVARCASCRLLSTQCSRTCSLVHDQFGYVRICEMLGSRRHSQLLDTEARAVASPSAFS